MSKNLKLILALILFLGVAYWAITYVNKSPSSVVSPPPVGTGESGLEEAVKANYVIYTDGVLDDYPDKKRVLFFYANWCPTCRPADKEFAENSSSIPDDLVLFRVNYNDNQTDAGEEALASRYGITYQHTFVQIDSEGEAVTRWNGGGLSELISNIK